MMGMGMGVGFSSPPPVWTPAALGATVEARWESDAGITLTSGRVSGWNDLKNAHHWTQGTAGYRPVVEDSVFGASKGIRFTAAASEQLTLTGGAIITGIAAAHAFLILKLASDTPVAPAYGLWRFGQSNDAIYPFTDGVVYDNFGSNSRKTTVNPVPSLATAHCYEVVSTASEWTNRINGAQLYTTATNTVAWSASGTERIGSSDASFLDGWIGALIICNAKLTGSDLTSMRAYLASKYGVTFA